MLSEHKNKHLKVKMMSKNMYVNSITMLSMLQRVFMKNIQIFLSHSGAAGINSTQALIVYHIGKNRIKVNEIMKNHFYEGSNPSYNLKKMIEADYLRTCPSPHDRRVLLIALSEKGDLLHREMTAFFQEQISILSEMGFAEQRWGCWLDEGQNLVHAWNHWGDRNLVKSDAESHLGKAGRHGLLNPDLSHRAYCRPS